MSSSKDCGVASCRAWVHNILLSPQFRLMHPRKAAILSLRCLLSAELAAA